MFDNDSINADLYGYDEPMTGPLEPSQTPTGRHPINITQLVVGVAFAGMVLIWALIESNVVQADNYRWLMPVPWLAAGAVGLGASVWTSRKRAGR